MILHHGDMGPHAALDWYMVELRSERTIESTLRRLGQALPALFRDTPIEIYIPILKRDLNHFELTTGSYIFARSPSFQKLLRLKTVTGVVGLSTLGDSNHPSQAIAIENAFVQDQIAQAELKFLNRAQSIEIGSFVRILDGDMRDWCGTVINIHDGVAVVRIEVKTKVILVETPVRNLLDKADVPESLRVFYYSDLVVGLEVQGLEELLADDLKYQEDSAYTDDGLDAQQPKRHSRQQTVTALVKRLVVTGTHDPATLGRKVFEALRAGSLKMPKNVAIIHGIIKHQLISAYFHQMDPTIRNYREVVERFGPSYRFSLHDLAALDPTIGIPLVTGDPSHIAETAS